MAMALRPRPFHLAVLLLSLLPHASAAAHNLLLPTATNASVILPPHASALQTGARDDAPPSTAGRPLRVPVFSALQNARPSPTTLSDDGFSSPRGHDVVSDAVARHDQDTTTASPPRDRRVRTRAAVTKYAYRRWGYALADLRDACQRPRCRADSDDRLLSVLYGPHHGGWDDYGWHHVYCAVRTVAGSSPILPCANSWRATVAPSSGGGGGPCHVELGHMDYDTYRIDCPAATCKAYCTGIPEEALAWAIDLITTPCGGVTSAAAPSTTNAALLHALPLFAIAFLPRPLAAAVALSSLASLALADLSEEEYLKLNHATCAVYPYDNATGTVDRSRPLPELRAICLRPLCIDADPDERTLSVVYAERHGRRDDPLRVYCAVHSLEGASSPSVVFPWRNIWRAHLPVADPDAAAASGDNVCYVELAHMDYREGYFIRCPASDGHAHASCTEFPEEAVASAVWEHRTLTYRDTVGPKCDMYKHGAAGTQFGGYDYDADL
ncbi:hypothetical protein ACP70R_018089 [Stipagrostis hirtigluma subsp. patula]